MWKLFILYKDKSKLTIEGKGKITLHLAREIYDEYVVKAESAIYQQYPKKDNKAIDLSDKIEELENALNV